MTHINLFETVKALCKEKGISIRKLESDLNMSQGSISHWKTSHPSYQSIQRVADYFNVTTEYLLSNKSNLLQSVLSELLDMSDDQLQDIQRLIEEYKS